MNTRVRGRLTAELRTDGNQPVPGFTLADCDGVSRTGFAQQLRWKGHGLGECIETEVRVLFRLEDAELFAFELSHEV